MDDVTADLLVSELDAMEAVDREWEDNDVSDQPAAVPTEELEARCGHECLNQPNHDGPHFDGYIMGRHSYEGFKAERDALRERVATLEGGIESHRRWVRQRDASGWMHKGTPHQAPNERLWSLLDVQGDTEGE